MPISRLPRSVCSLALLCALAGCSSSGSTRYESGERDPLFDMNDQKLPSTARVQAVDAAWAGVESGTIDRALARESLKTLIWKGGAPSNARERALEKLIADTTPEGRADTLKLLRLRLPTETQWPVINAVAKAAADHAGDPEWTALTAPLVRSYARKVPEPPDAERPERDALLALHPGSPLPDIVFGVYLRPAESGAAGGTELVQKARDAAWELLGRLDPSGAERARLLGTAPTDTPELQILSRAVRELGVVPITGSELAWARSLTESKDPQDQAWWSEAASAVGGLGPEQRNGLQLRHVEPVRWAAANKPEWCRAHRAALLSELSDRLEPRRKWRKTEGLGVGELQSRELLREWEPELAWGDLLAILVIDEALSQPDATKELLDQSNADRLDTSTEYGGALVADPSGPAYAVRSFPPRPAQRINDRTFVGSDDLFRQTGRSLAHYHFHAQTPSNGAYAGPGVGDLEYALTHGRSCVVLTSVRNGALNADVYARGRTSGVVTVVDLGEIGAPR